MKNTLFLPFVFTALSAAMSASAVAPPVNPVGFHSTQSATEFRNRPIAITGNPANRADWLEIFKHAAPQGLGWDGMRADAFSHVFEVSSSNEADYVEAFQAMFSLLGEDGMDILAGKNLKTDEQIRTALAACPSGPNQAKCNDGFKLALETRNLLGIDLWDLIQRQQGSSDMEKMALVRELELRMSDPKMLSTDPQHPGPLALFHLDGLDLVRAFRNWSALREMNPADTNSQNLRSVPSVARMAIEHFTSMEQPQRDVFVAALTNAGGLNAPDPAMRRAFIAAKVWDQATLDRNQVKEEDRAFYDELTKPGGARALNAARVAKWQNAVVNHSLASLKQDSDFGSAPAWLLSHATSLDDVKAFADHVDGNYAYFAVQPTAFSPTGDEALPVTGTQTPTHIVRDGAVLRVPLDSPEKFLAFARQIGPLIQTGRMSFSSSLPPNPAAHPQTLTYTDGNFNSGTTQPPAGKEYTAGTTGVRIDSNGQTIWVTEQGGQPHTFNVLYREREASSPSQPEKWNYYAVQTVPQGAEGNVVKIETAEGAPNTRGTATLTSLNTVNARPQGSTIHVQGSGATASFFVPHTEAAGNNPAWLFINATTSPTLQAPRVIAVVYTGPVTSGPDHKKVYLLRVQRTTNGPFENIASLSIPDEATTDATLVFLPTAVPAR